MKQNEMGGACGTYWGRTRAYAWGNLRKRGHLEDLDVDGKVILKCILKKWVGRV